jgi:hypothetical protein
MAIKVEVPHTHPINAQTTPTIPSKSAQVTAVSFLPEALFETAVRRLASIYLTTLDNLIL